MTDRRRVRVYVAGAPAAPITEATLVALARNPEADLVGLDLRRIDPTRIRDASPDLLVSAAHESMIRTPELGVARVGSVGLHPGLLPRYRGSHPLWWAIRNHETEAGLTLYVLDDGIDSGPIIAQTRAAIEPADTFASLYRRVARLVGPMLDDLIEVVAATDALPPSLPQDGSLATYFGPPSRRQLDPPLPVRAWAHLRRLAAGGHPHAQGLDE
jgi:methionyl-tRNA formyltransferase